jgi:hypothetical protein
MGSGGNSPCGLRQPPSLIHPPLRCSALPQRRRPKTRCQIQRTRTRHGASSRGDQALSSVSSHSASRRGPRRCSSVLTLCSQASRNNRAGVPSTGNESNVRISMHFIASASRSSVRGFVASIRVVACADGINKREFPSSALGRTRSSADLNAASLVANSDSSFFIRPVFMGQPLGSVRLRSATTRRGSIAKRHFVLLRRYAESSNAGPGGSGLAAV